LRSFEVISPQNVKHLISSGEQIVRDDSAMASPPNSLCARYGASLGMSQFSQSRQSGLELLAHRVIGEIVKASDLPKGIQRTWHDWAWGSRTSELSDVLIVDNKLR
jgi:hypothetical protein